MAVEENNGCRCWASRRVRGRAVVRGAAAAAAAAAGEPWPVFLFLRGSGDVHSVVAPAPGGGLLGKA